MLARPGVDFINYFAPCANPLYPTQNFYSTKSFSKVGRDNLFIGCETVYEMNPHSMVLSPLINALEPISKLLPEFPDGPQIIVSHGVLLGHHFFHFTSNISQKGSDFALQAVTVKGSRENF